MSGPRKPLALTDARELDWSAARTAAQRILRICDNAVFAAPEALDVHQDNVRHVCRELDQIVAALRINPPEGAP